ncbi:MAG: hypothetical protein HKN20_13225 [Gemmatimonadetes bacterium]|nr:hypothetical protein [Gemmatimonadota bacterium]
MFTIEHHDETDRTGAAAVWKRIRLAALMLVAVFGTLVGCGDDNKTAVVDPGPPKAGCVECHTDQSRLMALAVPDTPPNDTGEG